ncbi:MAG: D-alanyl-D-alanine carboxypeptidase family protein [Gammaproteobacteria bacterium]
MRCRFAIFFLLVSTLSSNVVASPIPAAPNIAARGYLLQDYSSGRILAEKNSHDRMEPASLTKLMTAYIVFSELASKSIKLDDRVRISKKAWQMKGSRMFIEVNKHVSVEDLLKGMIVQSGNDASVALAEFVAGSEDAFASLMNHYAQKIGMSATNYVNSTGMPHPDHYTTIHDLSILTRHLIDEFPEYYKWYSVREFTYNSITQYNRNKLLWRDDSVDGVKTGHTESAGFCLIASALQKEMRLISIVLGTKSEEARAQESQKLLNYGFRFFETHRLFSADVPLKTVRIWKGDSDQLPLGLSDDFFVTIPRGQYKNLNPIMKVENSIMAPAKKGQSFGIVEVSLDGEILDKRSLVSLENIVEGGIVDRLTDEFMLLFE